MNNRVIWVSPVCSCGGIYCFVGQVEVEGKMFGLMTDSECSACDLIDVNPYSLSEDEEELMWHDPDWYEEHHVDDFSEEDGLLLYKKMLEFVLEIQPHDDWSSYDIGEIERIYKWKYNKAWGKE